MTNTSTCSWYTLFLHCILSSLPRLNLEIEFSKQQYFEINEQYPHALSIDKANHADNFKCNWFTCTNLHFETDHVAIV